MNSPDHPKEFHYKKLHINLDAKVYDPAEDTFLLLDTIQYSHQDSVLEIGTGCGIIALSCAQNGAQVIATDINPFALLLAAKNIHKNKELLHGTIELVRGNLFNIIKKHTTFDIIIFNPPYLPTSLQEKLPGWINHAYDGGKNGTTIIELFIFELKEYFKSNGSCFFVGSSLQNLNKIQSCMEKTDLTHKIINQQLIGDEHIQIYHIIKK
jgi:release factor glutamine methyltransferase